MKLQGTWSGSWQAKAASIRSRDDVVIMISPFKENSPQRNRDHREEEDWEKKEEEIFQHTPYAQL